MAEINTSMDQSLLGSQRADTLDLENGDKLAWHAVYNGKLLSTKHELLVTLGPKGDLCLDLVGKRLHARRMVHGGFTHLFMYPQCLQESGTQDCWPKRCQLPSKVCISIFLEKKSPE